MSLFDRLKRFLGFDSADAADDTDADVSGAESGTDDDHLSQGSEAALTCTVCGTNADAGATACPLCKSTDLRPATAPRDVVDPVSGEASDDDSTLAEEVESADSDLTETRARTSEADDEAVDRLRELRQRDTSGEEET